jgi:folate-binding protein YgfZ
MSAETELEAIRTSAAIFPLSDRAFLRITGSDASRWLNGMVTNSIQSLAPGEGNYNFLLNAQGRIQADCTIYCDSKAVQDNYLLETDSSQIDTIKAHLDHFIIMDDVELTDEFTNLKGILIVGNAIAVNRLLAHTRLAEDQPSLTQAKPPRYSQTDISRGFVLLHSQLNTKIATDQFELWVNPNNFDRLLESLRNNGVIEIVEISPEALEAHRILSATPKYGVDIRNTETHKDLPQETAQTHALHFNKGCYLGQEIVERIRSRGQVHRTFTQFTLTGQLPELPATLEANGKPAGELTSAIQIGDTIHALGYLRREAFNQPLTYPGGAAVPQQSL